MATTKKNSKKGTSSVTKMIAKAKADAAAKRAQKAEGNAALDRANAIAKKGSKKAAAKKPVTAKAAKPVKASTVETIKEKATKPQFFGRPKTTAKAIDPEKVKQERRDLHNRMMRVDWYAEHRARSIELWVARRKAQAEGNTAEVEKINAKLDRLNAVKDKARAAWKEAGSIIPDTKPVKPTKAEKKATSKKAAAKTTKKGSKKGDKVVTAESDTLGTVTIPDATVDAQPPVTE